MKLNYDTRSGNKRLKRGSAAQQKARFNDPRRSRFFFFSSFPPMCIHTYVSGFVRLNYCTDSETRAPDRSLSVR